MISPVLSRDRDQSRVERVLRLELRTCCWGRFWAWSERGVKERREWWMMRVVMMREISWQVNEEVSRDMTGEVDVMNPGVDSRDGVMRIWMTDLWSTAIVQLSTLIEQQCIECAWCSRNTWVPQIGSGFNCRLVSELDGQERKMFSVVAVRTTAV